MSEIFIYDTETYPNVFTIGVERLSDGAYWEYEISDFRNDIDLIMQLLHYIATTGGRMLGFNNEHFDYPVVHLIWTLRTNGISVTAADIFAKADAIIKSDWNDWSHNVWPSDRFAPQIDLFKIMHFDNFARSTSLKKLEMAMRSRTVKDLPFPPGTVLNHNQVRILMDYQRWDVSETRRFALEVMDRIEFRDKLTAQYGMDFTNFNDTKIGKQFFIKKLEEAGIACYERVSGRKMARHTPHPDGIRVSECLMPVPFQTTELQAIWNFYSRSTIPADKTKGFFTGIKAPIGTLTAYFGSGGIHASTHNRTFRRSNTHKIVDVDVTSYYPTLAIANRFYPAHLGEEFCDIYEWLFHERQSHAKGTAENAMLKLALNGVYGDSNNKHSPFYDASYTMKITINGQMLLAWLAEMVATIPNAELIQINTDGLTVNLPYGADETLDQICRYWEQQTRLKLESVEYESMFIRDVNNYVAVDVKGKVKRKNAFLTEPDWHQDHGSLVIPKAVDAFLINGVKPVDYIYNCIDPFDFMRHVKVPKRGFLEWGDDLVQNTSRYYISLTGEPLVKTLPDTKTGAEKRTGIDVGWRTQMCNDVGEFDWNNLNRRYYVQQADKLVENVGLDPYA